jgi:hypothetical protein
VKTHRDIDEQRGADGDQHIRAQTGRALTILAFQTDDGPEHEGDEQTCQCVQGGLQVEVLK